MPSIRSLLTGAALGAVTAYYLDPDRGRARRAKHRDQLLARSRRATRDISQQARYAEGRLDGMRARADGRGHLRPVDDIDIKQGIERELSRADVDVADVVVDVTDGVAGLRGQVGSPNELETVELVTAGVPGVNEVQSWLHLPGVPAPNKAASRRAG